MISREHFLAKLRELGYVYKSRTKSLKNDLYRKKGGTHCVMLPRQDLLSEMYIRSTLQQCGQNKAQIEIFIASCIVNFTNNSH